MASSSRHPARAAAPLIASLLLAGACGQGAPRERNVILITCDTLRPDRLGVYGCERPTSPRLDAFARGAVVFDTAYASAPWTRPALSSLMTGRYPEEIGAAPSNLLRMPAAVETLAERLAAHGFATAAIVSNGLIVKPDAAAGDVDLAQGFATYDDRMTSRELHRDMPERGAAQTTDAALAWLASHEGSGGGPFFLWVHYQDPHGPYVPPPSLAEAFDRSHASEPELPLGATMSGLRQIPFYQVLAGLGGKPEQRASVYRDRYDAEIAYFDSQLGRLFDGLEQRAWWPDALVVVSADHGESLGEGERWFCHGESASVESLRVPLIARFPRGASGPPASEVAGVRRVAGLAGHVDLWPTVLDALDLPLDGGRGVSLLSSAPPAERVLLQSFLPPDEARRQWAATDGRWRAVWGADGVARLFDHAADPREERDLAADHPEIVQRLRGTYEAALRAWGQRGVQGVEVELDEAALQELRRLGYAEAAPDEGGK
jgi:arylsulfatase A-like enzyme